MASVLYVLHLTIPVDMYFISVSAIKALFVLLLILITFWMKTTKFKMHAKMDHLSPQKAPGVSPQTNVIKEELFSIKLKNLTLYFLYQQHFKS